MIDMTIAVSVGVGSDGKEVSLSLTAPRRDGERDITVYRFLTRDEAIELSLRLLHEAIRLPKERTSSAECANKG